MLKLLPTTEQGKKSNGTLEQYSGFLVEVMGALACLNPTKVDWPTLGTSLCSSIPIVVASKNSLFPCVSKLLCLEKAKTDDEFVLEVVMLISSMLANKAAALQAAPCNIHVKLIPLLTSTLVFIHFFHLLVHRRNIEVLWQILVCFYKLMCFEDTRRAMLSFSANFIP